MLHRSMEGMNMKDSLKTGLSLLIVALLVKIDSPGPVLFKQDRIGKNGKVFKILKFQ